MKSSDRLDQGEKLSKSEVALFEKIYRDEEVSNLPLHIQKQRIPIKEKHTDNRSNKTSNNLLLINLVNNDSLIDSLKIRNNLTTEKETLKLNQPDDQKIIKCKELGYGGFAKVCLGIWNGKEVAIKEMEFKIEKLEQYQNEKEGLPMNDARGINNINHERLLLLPLEMNQNPNLLFAPPNRQQVIVNVEEQKQNIENQENKQRKVM